MKDIEVGEGLEVMPYDPPELAKPDPSYVPAAGMDVQSLMQLALERDGAVEVIKELVQLRNDEMDRQAKLTFGRAFAEFHRLCPPIPRDCVGKTLSTRDGAGQTTLMFAGLETIQRVVDPLLGKLGFSYAHTVPIAKSDMMQIECELFHEDGHSRVSQMIVPVGKIPQASVAQNYAGAVTTGKRVTLTMVLGLSTEDADLAAERGETRVIDDTQFQILKTLIVEKGLDIDVVLNLAEVESLSDLPVEKFEVVRRFVETRS